MRRRSALLLGGIAVILTGLILKSHFTTLDFPHVNRGLLPPNGRPRTAAELRAASFDHWLPPPPIEAMPYEIGSPLFNGKDVVQKRRWLWIPTGTQIQAERSASGWTARIPQGALLWKEFWVRGSAGPRLIERRLMERVANGNGLAGWRFYKSHYLPARPQRRIFPSAIEASAYYLHPDAWLPTQPTGQSVTFETNDDGGEKLRYVFPGKGQCIACHAGASGWYGEASDSLAFGVAELIDVSQSRDELIRRRWLIVHGVPPFESSGAGAFQTETDRLVAMLRTNCLSCHNPSEQAMAQRTGFVLDPRKRYRPDELEQALSRRGVMMGADTQPLLDTNDLERSEILIRLKGTHGRRRMPPLEGGVATTDEKLNRAIREWASSMTLRARNSAPPSAHSQRE